ncbi:unnamed protein product [Larinioides sclopetarius]
MSDGFIKIKEEPVDEIQSVNNVDEATINSAVQNIDNLQNKCSTSSQEQLDFNKLLEENKKLKESNIEIKEKTDAQEKLMDYYKENFSRYEANILNTNLGIDQLKKKLEVDEREITTLKLQLQMLQNKVLRIQNTSPEKGRKGTKRKNEENLNLSPAIGKEKENVFDPARCIASYSSTLQNSSKENQNVHETAKSNSVTSVIQDASVNEADIEFSNLGCFSVQSPSPSHLNDLTQSLNDIQSNSHHKNLHKDQDIETVDSSKDLTPAIAFSVKSKNTCDVGKSVEKNSSKANTSINKPNIKNKGIEKPANRRSMKVNSSLNTPEIIIIDIEKSTKARSAKANVSQKAPEIITIDDEDSEEESSSIIKYPNPSEIVDSEKSANANVSLNKSDTKTNDIKNPVCEGSVRLNSSLNTSEIIIDADKCAKKSSANINTSLDELDLRINNVEKIGEGNSFEAPTSVNVLNIKPCSTNKVQEQFETSIHEHCVSSTERTNINSSNLNCKQNGKPFNFGGTVISSLTPNNTKPPKKKKLKKDRNIAKNTLLSLTSRQRKRRRRIQNFSKKFQSKTTCINSQDLNDTSAPKLTSFLTENCLKLASELDRIKNSAFSKYRESTNLLFDKLENINTNELTDECFFHYVHSLIDYFSDPKTMDMPTLIYLVVDYLSSNKVSPDSLFTYLQNQDVCVYIQPSENCIVHALFEIERKSLPHLNGLIRNTLNIIHQVMISKKKMAPNGLSSLCRVFMEICKINNDRWEPLFLCCELLRLRHRLAPYLINSLAGVWRTPFCLFDKFSAEENMLLGSINYGMKEKPTLMDSNLWMLTVRLRSTYFPHPLIIPPHQAIQFLTTEIFSRCERGLFQNLWMLASPLIIYVLKETWKWKKSFRDGYLEPKLLHFSRCSNEQGFGLFCNLYVDIFSRCPESPFGHTLQFFASTELHQGVKFVQDCVAVALLKYIGIKDKHIPALLRDWFLKNQENPKLAILIHLYCKKVMESHDSFLKWDDIIIV